MAGMTDEHRKILQRHRADLVKDLEPLKLLNDLAECLDEDDREAVKACQVRKDMAEELLDIIPRKGPKAFQCFVAALHKRQKHLAKPLIEESGIDISTVLKDDVGMTSQHKQILISNVENLQEMNLEKVVQLLHLSDVLDDTDKQNLLADTKLPPQRIDMLLTEILPRKGPKAFEIFAQELEKVNPPMAHRLLQDAGIKSTSLHVTDMPLDEILQRKSPKAFESFAQVNPTMDHGLLQDAGIKRSSNGDREIPKSSPIHQETGSFTLDSPVQEVLDVKPEFLKIFGQQMDEEDMWGNGWRRFYQELGLPAGKETRMEGRDVGPTLSCIKGWISMKGRSATVQALLAAVNRAERKDCSYYLEKNLGCQLDYVDSPLVSPVESLTRKMESSNFKEKKVEFFGDLDENEASEIEKRLKKDTKTLLEKELKKALGINDSLPIIDLMQRTKTYPIRKFTDSVRSEELRENLITTLRDVLSTYRGVTGPLLPPRKYIRDIGYSRRRDLTTELCGDKERWKLLADRLGMENSEISFLDVRPCNPANEVLSFWEVKSGSTVGALYDILVELGYPYIADLL